jgi:periplasmic protein TonB
VTHKDRPKLPLLVLAAGGILLGAAALQSVLITVPGSTSSNPHAITVDAKPAAAAPKPWDEPSPPTVELAPAEPADPSPTGAVPDAPQSADHAVDPAAPASPAKAESTGDATATETAKRMADEPKVETPPVDLKPAPKPEPSQIATSEPETVPQPEPALSPMPDDKPVMAAPKAEPQIAEPGPMPQPDPAKAAQVPEETLEPVVKALSVPDEKPVEETKVETLPDEPIPVPQPEPAQVAASPAREAKPEAKPVPAAAKTEAVAKATSPKPKPEPQPVAKAEPRDVKPAPKSTPAERPKETAAVKTQGGLLSKPMSLGFGRKPTPAAGKVSSGRYAANVRAAIGRHRPRVGGGGSATVAFSIGPGGGLQGVRIVRSSGKQAADQAAIATVRAAAPFPPPPAGTNTTFSIQIYFR